MRRSHWAAIAFLTALACVVGAGIYSFPRNPNEIAEAPAYEPWQPSLAARAPADPDASPPVGQRDFRLAFYAPPSRPAAATGEEAPSGVAEEVGTPVCPVVQDVYALIARVTQGKDITAIIDALAEVQGDPQAVRASSSGLALELRSALNLNPAASPCESILQATGEALRLARLAAGDGEATGAIGQRPAVTSTFATLPYGSPEGAGGSGYGAQ